MTPLIEVQTDSSRLLWL